MKYANKIDIKAESFPWQAKLVGALFLVGGIAMFITVWWLAVILVLVGLLLLTGHSGTVFDREKKIYLEYNSYLFFRRGEKIPYNRVEKIFINSERFSQKVFTPHTLDSATFYSIAYNAYLKFDNGRKIYLTTCKKKSALIGRIKPVAEFLQTSVHDYARVDE